MDPLVSIVVITFNSSEFILETLESAKTQTYHRIELIISDDCSKDNTVEICKTWLDINKERFVRTQIIKANKNTGTSANCNRGVSAAQGEWIKIIAGDDILDANIISKQIDYLKINTEIKILWTNVSIFYDTENGRKSETPSGLSKYRINKVGISAQEQFQIALRVNPVFVGGMLINRKVFLDVGMYDETYAVYEDLPFIHKVLRNGIPLHYMDIIGAYYRKHNNSVQIGQGQLLRNTYKLNVYKYQINILKYYNNIVERLVRYIDAKYNLFFTSHISNKKNTLNKILLYTPSYVFQKIIRLFSVKYR